MLKGSVIKLHELCYVIQQYFPPFILIPTIRDSQGPLVLRAQQDPQDDQGILVFKDKKGRKVTMELGAS